MSNFIRWLAISDHSLALAVRRVRTAVLNFSLPVPKLIIWPILGAFIALRECYFFFIRVFVCEPLFKGYCTQRGRGLRTGVFIHWVRGNGKLVVGDNVLVDGKVSFHFATRYAKNPVLSIGSNTVISHGCSFTVGRQVSIGEHCLIAEGVYIFDAPGHPSDPALRKAGSAANPEDVRAVNIQDNVWIGRRATIFPGVTVGEGSVVAMGASVMNDVPPYTMVAGDPARVIRRLNDPNVGKNAYEAALEGVKNESEMISLSEHVGTSVNSPLTRLDLADAPTEATVPKTSTDELVSAVMTILRATLATEDLTPDEDFYDAGVTSIMALPLLLDLEERFGVSIPDNEFLEARTGCRVAACIDRLVGADAKT